MKYMVNKGTDVLIQCSGADVLIYVEGKGLNGGRVKGGWGTPQAMGLVSGVGLTLISI